MRTLQTINMWELTESLKWTAFKRLSLLFMDRDFDRFFREKGKVRKVIDRDLKIAKAENREVDIFIREFAVKAENEMIENIPF